MVGGKLARYFAQLCFDGQLYQRSGNSLLENERVVPQARQQCNSARRRFFALRSLAWKHAEGHLPHGAHLYWQFLASSVHLVHQDDSAVISNHLRQKSSCD